MYMMYIVMFLVKGLAAGAMTAFGGYLVLWLFGVSNRLQGQASNTSEMKTHESPRSRAVVHG